ncbi:MAG: nucleotide sugar dehydrogenase [Saprospiraceae bacterium]|nr:nucleotide sugar dehydrogenase [Saprospiraceae bacterium]
MASLNKIGVIGLGYVGLPVALEFARDYQVVAFDIDSQRIAELQQGIDITEEMLPQEFEGCDIHFTDQKEDLKDVNFYIVAVPTPVDEHKIPQLDALRQASKTIGEVLSKNDIVVFESTVFPGCTEEICIPEIEKSSGLRYRQDFKAGYSPERINPGDRKHTLRKIKKIVSATDEESLERVYEVYSKVIEAGIFKAKSIKVAEAAKIIENTQRDVNIALMNELSIIFDRVGIRTKDVLEAASTKWNFINFHPGLVGGHCIDVDPYYLSYKSIELGYTPDVILSGRKVNNQIPHFIAHKVATSLVKSDRKLNQCRVLIYGLTFKENVRDLRNSRVFDLVNGLEKFEMHVDALDPHADPNDAEMPSHINLIQDAKGDYDAIILAVAHEDFIQMGSNHLLQHLKEGGVIYDVKTVFPELQSNPACIYLSL